MFAFSSSQKSLRYFKKCIALFLILSFFSSGLFSTHELYAQVQALQQRDVDTDRDGLPDWWEMQNGKNPQQPDSFPSLLWILSTGQTKPTEVIQPLPAVSGEMAGYSLGEFAVGDTGSAHYKIPLVLPPGTSGMQPKLSLTYQSSDSNGILGLGWTLTGLSEIGRSGATVINDGFTDPVNFDINDRFTLDGKRLIAISGVYGANGTEYRTESESFSKIISYGGSTEQPDRFTVWTKEGLMYDYGKTEDSKFRVADTQRHILGWKLSKITDTKGNEIEFVYETDASAGTQLIKEIRYTGNPSQGLVPFAKAVFQYEDRSDKRVAFVGGGKFQQLKRLKKIETYSSSQLIKKYELTYDEHPLTKASRLISFKESDAQGNSLAPLQFTWQNVEMGVSQPTRLLSASRQTLYQQQNLDNMIEGFPFQNKGDDDVWTEECFVDVNGDGLPDRFFQTKLDPTDFTKEESGFWVALNNGNGFNAPVNWMPGFQKSNPNFDLAVALRHTKKVNNNKITQCDLVDMDGDGLPDKVMYVNPNTGVYGFWVALNTGNGFSDFQLWVDTHGVNNSVNAVSLSYIPKDGSEERLIELVDMNGDSRPDRVFYKHPDDLDKPIENSRTGVWVALNNGQGFDSPTLWSTGAESQYIQPISSHYVSTDLKVSYETGTFKDMNGDVLLDRIKNSTVNAIKPGVYVWINSGTLFSKTVVMSEDKTFSNVLGAPPSFYGCSQLERFNDNYSLEEIRFLDMNGDGLPDRITHKNDAGVYGLWVELNNGTSFESPQLWWNTNGIDSWKNHSKAMYRSTSYTSFNETILDLRDINGDGLPDRVSKYHDQTNQEGIWVAFNNGTGFGSQVLWQPTGTASIIASSLDYTKPGYFNQTFWTWMDINGDGYPDFITKRPQDGVFVGLNKQKHDFITKITDGLGKEILITYKPLSDSSVYSRLSGAVYPMVDIQNSIPVVSDYQVSNGLNGYNKMSYFYSGLRRLLDGRGFCGFNTIQATDIAAGLVTKTVYKQNFPFKALTDFVEVRTVSGTLLSRVENSYGAIFYGDSRFSTFQNQTNNLEYELDGRFKKSLKTSYTYDDFGNPLQITQEWNDGYKKTVQNSYQNQTSNWIIGRLLNSSVVSIDPNGNNQERHASFTYDSQGLLLSETEEPNTSIWLKKTYYRDGFGNILSTLIEGADILPRTESTLYEPKGRFSIKKTNAIGQTETYTFEEGYGQILSLTGPNGLTTRWTYDGFGRKILQENADGTSARTMVLKSQGQGPAGSQYFCRVDSSGKPPVITYFDSLNRDLQTKTLGYNGETVFSDKQYDVLGRVIQESLPYFTGEARYVTQTSYDLLNRPIQMIAPDNGVSSVTYMGTKIMTTNALNQTEIKEYDSQGNIIKSTDALGHSNTYAYDALGHLLRVVDVLGNQTIMEYNLRGQRTKLTDPNAGTSTYQYNVLGQLLSQKDAKQQEQTFSYDLLGRTLERNEAEGRTIWQYDNTLYGIGKLSQILGPNGYEEKYVYDELGRVKQVSTTIDGESFTRSQDYDVYGRVKLQIFPSGLSLFNVYNQYGYLEEIKNANLLQPVSYWKIESKNSKGQVLSEKLGENVKTVYTYSPQTGLVKTITSFAGSTDIQKNQYEFDKLANLTQRQDIKQSLKENFGYDVLNRLTSYQVEGQRLNTVTYDAVGNIRSRSDLGVYDYGNQAGPHAVTKITPVSQTPVDASVSGAIQGEHRYQMTGNLQSSSNVDSGSTVLFQNQGTIRLLPGFKASAGSTFVARAEVKPPVTTWNYTYDANGSRIAGPFGELNTYTSFNKVRSLQKNGVQIQFDYGPDHQCIKQTKQVPSIVSDKPPEQSKILYFGNYERHTVNGKNSYIHYISGENGVVSQVTIDSAGATQTQYVLKDHLGSIEAVVGLDGKILERYSYDVWGKHRQSNWADQIETFRHGINKGFTGHEPLDDVGLVQMGGRVYDPVIGRFIQADPFVQEMENTQNLNRYAYVLNNPLSKTDPSGYFFDDLGKMIRIAILVGAVFASGGWAAGIVGANTFLGAVVGGAFGGAIGGASGVLISGGNVTDALNAGLKGALVGGVSGAMFNLIGGTFKVASFEKVLAHGVAGGLRDMLGGGRFDQGFYSGAFVQLLAPGIDGIDPGNIGLSAARVAIAALAGGVASAIGGGKFLDGAVTGAFSRMFNDENHNAKLKENILKDGRIVKQEAKQWYKQGKGEALHVPLKNLDLSRIHASDFPDGVGSSKVFNLLHSSRYFSNLQDGLVYGSLTFTLIAPDTIISTGPDTYDYEMHKIDSLSEFGRNILTYIGSKYDGDGIPFKIYLDGEAKIKP